MKRNSKFGDGDKCCNILLIIFLFCICSAICFPQESSQEDTQIYIIPRSPLSSQSM